MFQAYNQFYDGKSAEIRSREVNGRLVLEGALRIHWGVHGVIHLKENDDQRTVTIRKRYSMPYQSSGSDDDSEISYQNGLIFSETNNSTNSSFSNLTAKSAIRNDLQEGSLHNTSSVFVSTNSSTLPSKLDASNFEKDELDGLLQIERTVDAGSKLYQTMPTKLLSIDKTTTDTQVEPFQNDDYSRAESNTQISLKSSDENKGKRSALYWPCH